MTLSIHRALIFLSSCSWLPWRFKEWVMRKCQYRLINPLSFNSSRDRAKWFEELHFTFFAFQSHSSCFYFLAEQRGHCAKAQRKKFLWDKNIVIPRQNLTFWPRQIIWNLWLSFWKNWWQEFSNSSQFSSQLFWITLVNSINRCNILQLWVFANNYLFILGT